ncbi:MAG: ABC transporter substrate-binding protein, partial [Clostridia bacterium]|nr:ABC transporter substrate-binding protein [Clostridia bacterium]
MKKRSAAFSRRLLAGLLSLVMLCVAGCTPSPGETLTVGALTGPTAMSLVKLMKDSEEGKTQTAYSFAPLATAAENLTPAFLKGELTFMACPCNLAAILYQKTQDVTVLAVNTLGVLTLVEKGENIVSLADLSGKTLLIPASLKGAAPEYAFDYLCSLDGLDPEKDFTRRYLTEPAEVVAALANTEKGIALLPEPYATVALAGQEDLHLAIDLSEEWDKKDIPSRFITGVLLTRTSFLQEHPDAVASFMEDYRKSYDFTQNRPTDTAGLLTDYGLTPNQAL